MAALMLGIDFSKTDMQISLWNEEKTCAEIYQFSDSDGTTDKTHAPVLTP